MWSGSGLLWVPAFPGDGVISGKYGCARVLRAQKYIHAEIYSLSLLGFFAQLNGCGCHGDLSFAYPHPTVFLLLPRLGHECLTAQQICLTDKVRQFSLPPVGFLFAAAKQADTEHGTSFLIVKLRLLSAWQSIYRKSLGNLKRSAFTGNARGVQERVGEPSLWGNMLQYDTAFVRGYLEE